MGEENVKIVKIVELITQIYLLYIISYLIQFINRNISMLIDMYILYIKIEKSGNKNMKKLKYVTGYIFISLN